LYHFQLDKAPKLDACDLFFFNINIVKGEQFINKNSDLFMKNLWNIPQFSEKNHNMHLETQLGF